MANAVIDSLPDSEWLLIEETQRAALAGLSEDELIGLHTRIRRARSKYVKNYRRGAAARVSAAGGRGKARPQSSRDRDRAEVFEDALARVSRALSAAAKRSAAELKAERQSAARAAKSGQSPQSATGVTRKAPANRATARTATTTSRSGAASTVTPRSLKKGASSAAQGARRQAKRDARTS
ncbi:MAG TPA: hypothetical protein VIM19_08235 [Actinomycetes bacterium]